LRGKDLPIRCNGPDQLDDFLKELPRTSYAVELRNARTALGVHGEVLKAGHGVATCGSTRDGNAADRRAVELGWIVLRELHGGARPLLKAVRRYKHR